MEHIKNLDLIIELAIAEDLGDLGDVTSRSIFTDNPAYEYSLIAKDRGVLCGIDIFKKVFNRIDETVEVETLYSDGDILESGSIVAHVRGPVVSILKSERTALNFLSHLSGIATKAALFAEKSGGFVRILDTRKTLPGYRELQKYAVRCGGCENHRMGLYDMVMIKDNHVDAAGSITSAVTKVRDMWGDRFKVEVETRNIEEVREALQCSVDRIMLDNMSNDIMKEAVEIIDGAAETEASGNMDIERLIEIKGLGIDFVSFGELTHTVNIFDFSLKEIR